MSCTTAISGFRKTEAIQRIENIQKKYNQNKIKTDYFKIFSHYVQTNIGTSSVLKLLINGCRWTIQFANILGLSCASVAKLSKAQSKFKFVNKNLILTKYPKVLNELKDAYNDYQKKEIKDITRKRDKLASKVVKTVSDTSFIIQLGEILSIYSLGGLGPIINFAGNFFMLLFNCVNLKIDTEDYYENDSLQKNVDGQKMPVKRLYKIFSENKNLNLLRMVKSIGSIAISSFLILDILFKAVLLSTSGYLLLSTCVTVFTIWSHFYKESMTYPLIN